MSDRFMFIAASDQLLFLTELDKVLLATSFILSLIVCSNNDISLLL